MMNILARVRAMLSSLFSLQWMTSQYHLLWRWWYLLVSSLREGRAKRSLMPSSLRRRELLDCLAAAPPGGPFWGKRLSHEDVAWLLALPQGRSLDLRGADLGGVDLRGFSFSRGNFSAATLRQTRLEGCNLGGAILEKADLRSSHLEGAMLSRAQLGGANLQGAYFDPSPTLADVSLCDTRRTCALLADVRWGGVNLATIDWARIAQIGDEQAIEKQRHTGAYRTALRAYRQLASALRDQGLLEEANSYAHRAQALKRPLRSCSLVQSLRSHPSSRLSLRWALRLRRFMQTWYGLGIVTLCVFLPLLIVVGIQAVLPSAVLLGVSLLALLLCVCALGLLLLPVLFQIAALLIIQILYFSFGLLLFLLALFAIFDITFSSLSLLPLLGQILFSAALVISGAFLYQFIVRRPLVTLWLVQLSERTAALFPYYWSLFQNLFIVLEACISLTFLWFLDQVSGYGYKPERCVGWYIGTLLLFALFYILAGQPFGIDTLVLSIAAFHGRGFFPGTIPRPNDLLAILAAGEAVIGLFLELSFIAAFTQRFYGK